MGSAIQILNSGSTHRIAQSKINAARITQASGNMRRAAEADAARVGQSLGNRRAMDAAGGQINEAQESIARNLDLAASGTIASRLKAAQEIGASMASAGALGQGGSTVTLFQNAQRLRASMAAEATERGVQQDLYSASNQIGDTLESGVQSLDNTQIVAAQDFTQYVDHKKMSGLSKFLAFSGAAAATYFGGPQAGAAVLDTFQAREDMRNGNFAAGEAKLNNAAGSALQGWQQYTSLAKKGDVGGAWGKGAWESVKKLISID